ncbi:unnamed protein product [Closterium sp. NIES-54]
MQVVGLHQHRFPPVALPHIRLCSRTHPHERSHAQSIENDVRLLEHATGKLVATKDPDPLGASALEVDEAHFEKAQLAASRWAARDDATVLAITDLLPLSEQHHFEQEVTAKGLFDVVVKRYSTPTTASLGRLVLPFLFPNLPSFPRVADLILHLRSLDAQLRSAAPDADLLATNPPAMWMTLYLLSTRLPDRFATARDHFLTVNPMSLTIDLFEKKLTTVEDLARSLVVASSVDSASVATASEVAAVAFGNKGGKKSGTKGGGGGSATTVPGVLVAAAEGVEVVVDVEVEAVEEELVGRPSSNSPSSSSRASTSRPSSSNGAHPAGRRMARSSTPPASTGCRLGRAETASVAASTLRVTRVACTGPTTQSASHSFTFDSGASSCFFRDHTNLTPLRTPVTVAFTDPSVGAVVAHNTTTLPCPKAPSGVHTGYYTPSLSRNLVGVSHLYDLGVVTTFPLDKPVASCTDGVTGAPLTTFPRELGSGHPTSPRLSRMACHRLGPSPVLGLRQERYFLIVVDDYSRYTTVFPLGRKANVPTVLEPWLLARGGAQGLCGLCLHSDRGGEFSSTRLETFCQGWGIIQSYSLPASPQQIGVAKQHIGLVMEVARTSMCHAGAPQFLWPQAVHYAAHQLN